MSNKKIRLDQLMTLRGLAESRELAQRLILAGAVSVNGQKNVKAGNTFQEDADIVLARKPQFVSRGGEKLQGAFEAFGISVIDLNCIDIGASTGGFTDCMLQHGAAHVIALDVGHGQIHPRISADSRVTVIERCNARYLTSVDLPFQPQFATVDVSFISLKLILPPLSAVLSPGAQFVTLIKPQFEAGRALAPKGVVRDQSVRDDVVEMIRSFGVSTLNLKWRGLAESPIRGPEGNVEYLAWWQNPQSDGDISKNL